MSAEASGPRSGMSQKALLPNPSTSRLACLPLLPRDATWAVADTDRSTWQGHLLFQTPAGSPLSFLHPRQLHSAHRVVNFVQNGVGLPVFSYDLLFSFYSLCSTLRPKDPLHIFVHTQL